MFPYALVLPVWLLVAVAWPVIQSLHTLQKGTNEVKQLWLFYWACFIACTWVFPFVEWLVYLPFYMLSHYVDIYYEAQVIFVLLAVAPQPLLIEKLFAYFKARMKSLDNVAIIVWNIVFVALDAPLNILARCALPIVSLLDASQREAAKDGLAEATITLISLAWRLALAVCFWVDVQYDSLSEFRRQVGSSGRPCVLLPNHVSYMDIVLAVTCLPLSKVGKVKMLMMEDIYSLPLIGKIAEAMGHIPITFKPDTSGGYTVDKDVVAKKMDEMSRHFAKGGYGGWFPEGQLNRSDVQKTGLFRAGGFSLCVKNDVEVWCLAGIGASTFWPRRAAVGGRPCHIGYKMVKVCDSSHEFLAGVTATGDKDLERAKAEHMANRVQEKMQAALDELSAAGFSGTRGDSTVF